ncbi:hypothetical protein [Ornithinimicrobium kibberense]|uniref:hypothetical protein n=1 Tax=Ornithinimicrobium kibberense TaxID=282060 RepID=UPI0036141C0A
MKVCKTRTPSCRSCSGSRTGPSQRRPPSCAPRICPRVRFCCGRCPRFLKGSSRH